MSKRATYLIRVDGRNKIVFEFIHTHTHTETHIYLLEQIPSLTSM